MRSTREGFFGWRVVAAAFAVAVFGWGFGFYGPPVFLHAVEAGRGWPLWLVSAAVTCHFLAGAAVVARLAALHRRFGVAAVTRGGAVLAAAGLLGWAFAAEPWQLFLATLFSGAGWATMGAAAISAMVAPWFTQRRPAAIGAAFNGASVGGVVFSPLWVALIGWIGFGATAVLVGAVMVAVLWWLSGRYLAATPAALGLAPDGLAADAPSVVPSRPVAALGGAPWRDRRFATLAAANALGLFAQIGLVAHLVSHLAPVLGAQGAGFAMGMATACAIAGRSLIARLLRPGADRRRAAASNYLVQVAGMALLALAGGEEWLLLAGVALFGLGLGNATSLTPLIAQQDFSDRDAARVVALVVAVGQAGYAFAPAAFGLLREVDGGAMFWVAAVCQAAAVVAVLAGRGGRGS
ncbi:MFS transporter [Falsiroseomonas sp.]|uniref:MFS transporter n=1 Tax=Falsiroseomonas sp. TaxID=2870721 RepID=UPI00356674C5